MWPFVDEILRLRIDYHGKRENIYKNASCLLILVVV